MGQSGIRSFDDNDSRDNDDNFHYHDDHDKATVEILLDRPDTHSHR